MKQIFDERGANLIATAQYLFGANILAGCRSMAMHNEFIPPLLRALSDIFCYNGKLTRAPNNNWAPPESLLPVTAAAWFVPFGCKEAPVIDGEDSAHTFINMSYFGLNINACIKLAEQDLQVRID